VAKDSSNNPAYPSPQRLSFPQEEARFEWLPPLLEAYHVADVGVAEGVAREEKQGRVLACRKGCSACCRTHKDIPVYPLELVGMTWYATEKVASPVRGKLQDQLRGYRQGDPCPFLVEGVCSVHPMRPLACRQFNVFGQPCAEGEDPFHTRRQDVMTPIRKYIDDALFAMLPFYGVRNKAERRKMIKSGAVHQLARELQSCNWSGVADKMSAFDRRQTAPADQN
jgi:Fe-S-cluster containining protein